VGDRVEYEETSWLSKGYGLAPFLLMSNPEISIGAKGLFCYLSSIAGAVVNEEFGGRASWPSRARICRDLIDESMIEAARRQDEYLKMSHEEYMAMCIQIVKQRSV